MNKRKALVLLVVLAFVMGCATTGTQTTPTSSKTVTYQTLQTGKITYDTAFKTLATLYADGKLSEAQKNKAIQLGNTYVAAHNQAVQNLLDDKPVSTGAVETALAAFLAYAQQFKEVK